MDAKKLITEKNVGEIDRAARLVLGVALMAAALFVDAEISFRAIIGIVALILLYTGAMAHCTLYSVLGISTCKIRK